MFDEDGSDAVHMGVASPWGHQDANVDRLHVEFAIRDGLQRAAGLSLNREIML